MMRVTLVAVKPSPPNSPAKLVLLTVSGAVLTSILFLSPDLKGYGIHRVAPFFIGFAIFATGVFLSLKSTSDLRRGVENQSWPESQLEPLRRHFEWTAYTAISIALFVAFVMLALPTKRFRGDGWVCFIFLQTISQLRLAFRRPQATTTPPPDWRNSAPIHSDHWGHR